ncbi:DUF11 domain-containing protein, partial [Lentimicrobium sp. S6]|uniref:DUF11 domain-containing protein n=1 Tax=Lentimicrobium sp. S6 TaxID=2735872 RepID=UPI0015567402
YVTATGIWTIGNLADGADTSLEITCTVNATGDYTNTATLTGTEDDPDPSNDEDDALTTPNPISDLVIVKSVDEATPNVGDQVIFTLEVSNNGPSAATGVAVTENLPTGYTYVSDNGSGAYATATGIWTIGNLADGADTSLEITCTVNATGDYTNTATLTGTEDDPDPSNNEDDALTTPNPISDLVIVKSVDEATP